MLQVHHWHANKATNHMRGKDLTEWKITCSSLDTKSKIKMSTSNLVCGLQESNYCMSERWDSVWDREGFCAHCCKLLKLLKQKHCSVQTHTQPSSRSCNHYLQEMLMTKPSERLKSCVTSTNLCSSPGLDSVPASTQRRSIHSNLTEDTTKSTKLIRKPADRLVGTVFSLCVFDCVCCLVVLLTSSLIWNKELSLMTHLANNLHHLAISELNYLLVLFY